MRALSCCTLAVSFFLAGALFAQGSEPGAEPIVQKVQFVAPEATGPISVPTSTISLFSQTPAVMPLADDIVAGELIADEVAIDQVGCGAGCGDGCSTACGDGCGTVACGGAACCGCGCGCGPYGICSTCDMGQHYPYFPPMHGYYYFRPYHHSHVRNHQMIVQTWGEDPANPYANQIFQIVYEQYKAERSAVPTPVPAPVPTDE